jgi:hypothetical protein
MKSKFKIAVVAAIIIWFVGSQIQSARMSYPEKFCRTYNSWNKNAWAVRHNSNTDTWQTLESQDYETLKNLVSNNDASFEIPISKYANQWFLDSERGDSQNGVAMAALLIVECEKYNIKIDEKWLG